MTVTRQNPTPRVYAWVSRAVDNVAWQTTDAYRHDMLDLSGDVVSLEASRDINGPMGGATLVLLPRTSDGKQTAADIDRLAVLYQRLDLMSVVSIGVDIDGGIGLYLVRSKQKRKQRAGPGAASTLTIQLVDFGYVLGADRIVFASLSVQTSSKFADDIAATLGKDSPLIVALPGVWGPDSSPIAVQSTLGPATSSPDTGEKTVGVDETQGVPTFLGQSPKEALSWILTHAASMRVPLLSKADGGEGRAGDYINTDRSVVTWNDARLWSDAPTSYQGTLWDFMWTVLDRDFYEMRLEYRPRSDSPLPRLELIVRPKPFDEPALEFLRVDEDPGLTWDSLTTFLLEFENHDILEHEVLDETLGISGTDAFGYYLVTSAHDLLGNDQAAKEGLAYPVVDAFITQKFGLQQYNARLSLLSSDLRAKVEETLDYDGQVFGDMAEFRNRLVNWHRLAPWFESGSITVVGRDVYRPGDPVRLGWQVAPTGNERGMRYYCTSVRWSWQFGSPYTCSLTLSRGHNAAMVAALRSEIDAASPTSVPSSLIVAGFGEDVLPLLNLDETEPETVIGGSRA